MADKLGITPAVPVASLATLQAFSVLGDHALMLESMPVLTPDFERASVRQTLAVMLVRPVTPLWFATQSGLGVAQNKQLLQYLRHSGCLQIMRVQLSKTSSSFDSIALDRLLKGA